MRNRVPSAIDATPNTEGNVIPVMRRKRPTTPSAMNRRLRRIPWIARALKKTFISPEKLLCFTLANDNEGKSADILYFPTPVVFPLKVHYATLFDVGYFPDT